MTNPYQGFEYNMHPEEHLPGEEQISPADPATLKGLMEVYRDTANQLNAEKLLTAKAHKDFTNMHEDYVNELSAKLKLEDEVKKERELKDLAIQGLNGFKEQSQKQLEKLRRHRNDLAGKVQKARKTSTDLNEWLEVFDKGDSQFEPIDILRDVARELNEELEVSEEEEEVSEAN